MDRGLYLIVLYFLVGTCNGKVHWLQLSDDERSVIALSSFGYLKGGSLSVNITNMKISHHINKTPLIGFSFDKSSSSGTSSYVEREESTHGCVLNDKGQGTYEDVPRAILKIELNKTDSKYYLHIKQRLLKGLKFYSCEDEYEKEHAPVSAIPATSDTLTVTDKPIISETTAAKKTVTQKTTPAAPPERKKRAPVLSNSDQPKETPHYVSGGLLRATGDFDTGLNFTFYVHMDTDEQNGFYELFFHNCENSESAQLDADFTFVKTEFNAHIIEKNKDSYLSAGDMELPLMYGTISLMFFAVGVVWVWVLCSTKEKVFKIHYLMAVIIFIKGMSVMSHSLDYHFIAKDGHTEGWAIIFYIVHLLKGILLIICLLLIGTGWAFIKYILSDRDKKLFMVVIPMQVMVNIAYIIMEETEEGNKSYYTWKNIVILVDVLCCGAILIPVVWSIRHLQEASQTDGKAAINLAKLELFRHFYIMVVCYLYFTRIIVYLLEITLPFQYIWIHALFSELGAFVFFSVTGYKFRPGCDNPYLKLDQYDSDEDVEEAITQSGVTENLTRVNKHEKDAAETDEFDVLLPKQRATSKV